jgi:hypothetical protein
MKKLMLEHYPDLAIISIDEHHLEPGA